MVKEQLGGSATFWRPLAAWLADPAVRERLAAIRSDPDVGHLHDLRVFDIVVWMRGKGYDADPEQDQTADEE